LKTLVDEYFHERLPSYADTVGSLHFDQLDSAAERTVRYACSDADYTLRLYHLLNDWLLCLTMYYRQKLNKGSHLQRFSIA
jgi:hypothetical protein